MSKRRRKDKPKKAGKWMTLSYFAGFIVMSGFNAEDKTAQLVAFIIGLILYNIAVCIGGDYIEPQDKQDKE